jgi:hypothetical protein
MERRPVRFLKCASSTARRALGAAILFLGALALGGCDAPTAPTTLDVTLTSTPDPAVATVSTDVTYTIKGDDTHPDEVRAYPWRTSFVVNIQETGGLAVDITSVNLAVQQAAGGIVIAPSGGSVERYQFNSSASGNHVNAKGSATVGFEVWYELPNKGREALITVNLTFKDEDGGVYQDSIGVKVAP